jgi:hypothetical protein
MTSRRVASVLFACVVAAVACTKPPTPGGKCEAGQAICESPSTVLACVGGAYTEVVCGGAGGCQKVGPRVTCDDSIAAVGDLCIEAGGAENRACTADKLQSLVCKSGKFVAVETCRGGCVVKGGAVACDTSGAQKGDACTQAGALACGSDGKSRLVCKDGKYAADRPCWGPGGCHAGDFACDESVADEGDPCSVSGFVACAKDGSRELVCTSGAYVASLTCKKGICRPLSASKIECK